MKRDEFCQGAGGVEDALIKREVKRAVTAVPGQADAALVVTPHPLTLQDQRILDAQAVAMLPGETLAALLARHGVLPQRQWVVCLGGVEVAEALWPRVKPKHGHLIEARRVPQQDALRFVAFVALAYVTGGIAAGKIGAGFVGGTLGFAGGTFGAALVAGAVGMAGAMVINRLLGPQQPDARALPAVESTYSLSGGRNQARQFQPMALVLGEPYAVPDLAAQPYTFFANGEQHLWQLMHCGINCAEISNIRVGQTAITTYQGVQLSYEGFAGGNTGLPMLSSSVDSVAGALLDAPGGNEPAGGTGYVTRTSSVNALQLAVDIEGSLFSVNQGSGAYEALNCTIELELRPVGGAWEPFNQVDKTIVLANASTKPYRCTFTRMVAPGQYEVRARKITANATASNQQNTIQWGVLKTYQVDSGNYKGQSRLGIQIQASGQLNGSLDEVNCTLRAQPMPYWDGAAWVTATTRANGLSNPGALILLLARGIYDVDGRLLAGVGLPDSQIDIDSLKGFMVFCAAKGFTFDYFLQETISDEELIDTIAAAGMGAKSWHTGKLGVIWFSDDQPVESVLNMGTFKPKSFSVDYATQETADEIEFQYFDRDRGNAWKSIRVLAPGVAVPTSTARQQLKGVTTEAHAATLARFSMAQNVYQRKSISAATDLEHLTFRRGTVMALSHDLTQWGYGGRVQAAVNNAGTVTLTLDDVVPAVGPSGQTARYIGLRIPGENQYRVFPVQAFAGSSRTMTLASAWPDGVPVPGDATINPAWDTIWIYDFKATPGQKVRVAGIEPTPNMSGARVMVVPETPEFWTYVWTGAYTPPPSNSLLQGPPVVTSVTMTELLQRQGNTFYTELTATLAVSGSYDHAELWGAVGNGPKQLLASSRSLRLSWRGGLSETWSLEVRPFSGIHTGAPFTLSYSVVGLAEPPPQFDTFLVLVQPDGTRQFNFGYTTTPKPIDWLGAEIRYLRGSFASPNWADMLPLNADTTHFTASPVETNQLLSGLHTFACRSKDTSGNLSTMRVIEMELPDRRLGGVLGEWDEDALLWPGSITNGFVNTLQNTLSANDSTTWATLPATFAGWTSWNMAPASPLVYTAPVRDLGAIARGLLSVSVEATGTQTLEMRYSNDNVNWSVWGDASIAFSGRYIQLRVSLASGGAIPTLSALSYRATVDAKFEALNDVVISTLGVNYLGVGDCRIPLANSYGLFRIVNAVIQDGRAGSWTWQLIDKQLTGPRVKFYLNGALTNPAYVDFYVEGY